MMKRWSLKCEAKSTLCVSWGSTTTVHLRETKEKLEWFEELLPERQGHSLALTVFSVPYSLDSEFGSRASGFGLRVSGFEFRVGASCF